MNINEFHSKNKESMGSPFGYVRTPRVLCKSGLEMSVQASSFHWCEPRDNIGPYSSMEIGFPNRVVEELLP